MSSYREIKAECYEANLLLPEYRLIDLTFGNVSIADHARGAFAIKPSGVDYRRMKPEDMVVVDLEGRTVEGSLRPSSDTPTHRRLFQVFTSVRAIVHTHSRNAVAFAQAGREIPCLGTTHADYFYGNAPVTRRMSPEQIDNGYEWETANVIIERFKGIDPTQVCGAERKKSRRKCVSARNRGGNGPENPPPQPRRCPNSAAVARQAFPAQTRGKRLLRSTRYWVIKVIVALSLPGYRALNEPAYMYGTVHKKPLATLKICSGGTSGPSRKPMRLPKGRAFPPAHADKNG